MKLLKLNHHGLPSIGITGQTGQTGENGKSIYFGFINDFFEGDRIDIATYVYAAKRAIQGIKSGKYTDASVLESLVKSEIAAYDDSSNTFCKYVKGANGNSEINEMPYVDVSILYYTGSRLSSSSMLAPGMVLEDPSIAESATALKMDINGEFLLMSFMIASALGYENASNNFVSYAVDEDRTPNENLAESLNVSNNIIYKNVVNNITYHSFTDNAALQLDINKKYNVNERIALKDTITFDTIDAIYNNDSSAAEAYALGTILDNSQYSNYYHSDDTIVTYINEDIKIDVNNPDSPPYATDGKSYKASFILDDSTYAIEMYDESQYFDNNYDHLWNEIFKTSATVNKDVKKFNSYYESGDILDENKNAFYGVPPRILFTNDETGISINTDEASTFLRDFPTYYNESPSQYGEWVHNMIVHNSSTGTYAYYTLNQNDTVIFIPMSLRSDIKPGDVIYFYTNQDDFYNGYNVNFMVVVTEDLLNCTPTELINAATLTDPINVKFFKSISKNRLCNFYDVAVLKNDVSLLQSDAKLKSLSNKSYVSIVDEYTSAAAILSSRKDFQTSIAYHKLKDNSTDINLLTLANNNENDKFVILTNNILKTKNLCVNQNNLTSATNVELSKLIYDSNVILYDNYFVKPLTNIDLYYDNNNEYASIFIENVNDNEYFRNIENLDNYFYGCDIYNKDMEKINTLTSDTDSLSVEIIPTVDNDTYYIQMFASCGTSIKYYSKLTKLSIVYEEFKYLNQINKMTVNSYDNPIEKYSKDIQGEEIKQQIKSFSLEIIGDDQNIIKLKYSGNIIFDISDITAEKIDDAYLKIYSDNDDIEIIDVMFNNTIYNASMNINDWSSITKNLSDGFEYSISMSTNLPKFYLNDVTASDYLSDYVISGHEQIQDANSEESALFILLTNDAMSEPTKLRSILVTAKYKFKDSDEIYYENFNLTQPGFTDTRNVPVIDLDIHSNIIDLESFNNLNNNVLSNQFVTYLDIDIKKFKEYWGKFANTSTNISMNIELRNLQYDFDWQNKYVVKDLYSRRTFRAINEKDTSILNNYIKTSISVIESTLDNDPDILVNSLIWHNEKYILPTFIDDCNCLSSDNNKYIIFNASFNDTLNDSDKIYNGLQNNITINLNKINVNHDSDKIRLKLLTEFGNPIISNMYYRFYVGKIDIFVNEIQFKTYVPDSIDENAILTYLCKVDPNNSANIINVKYKYISDPLDVTFNPLSYTVCPNDIESTYTNIYGDDIYKYGIHELIIKELSFFNNSVYTSDKYAIKDKIDIRKTASYDFANLNIKKSYVLDNIKNISVKPISLYDIIENIDTSSNKSLNIDSSLIDNHYILDFIEGNKYLSIVYHSTLLLPKIRNNQYTFYYNDVEYPRMKYDQKINNLPVFAYDEQSIELRDDNLIMTMDKLNDWYTENRESQNKNTYQGVLSLYGNGYTQIVNDSEQFNNYYSLDEVIEMNNENITTYVQSSEVNIDPMTQDLPNKDEYLRGFLYDINWEFPYYDNHNIIPYRIVSPFDNFLNNNVSTNGKLIDDISIYQEYYSALVESDKEEKLYGTNMIPYTLLYDIQPRIAYNYDNKKINVFMLRRPSIGVDTDIINGSTFTEKYEFNRRLFNINNFKKLISPYTVEE